MQIREVMSRDVILASSRQTIGEVAQMMAARDIGFMPVGDRDRIIGMITDRDIVVRGHGAACAPEFHLFDSRHKLFCRDRFDDSAPINDRLVTGANLAMAVEAASPASPLPREQSPAMSCSVNWR